MYSLGKIVIIVGIIIVILGIVIYFAGSKFSWIGRLPGDIHIERENFRFYFPITTMIIISLIATIVMKLFKKL